MSQLPTGFSAQYWSTWYTQLNRSVAETLEGGEAWIGSWTSVGLYEKDNKVAEYQSVSVHLTTHRLILIPDTSALPSASSSTKPPGLQVHLRHVRQTEFYTGFMRSSPKITLSLGRAPSDDDSQVQTTQAVSSWACGVCGFVNSVSGPNGTLGSKCGLCGVGYTTATSISSPVTRTNSPAPPKGPPESAPVVGDGGGRSDKAPLPPNRLPKEIACPACTFLNHPSLTNCEICSTALPKGQTGTSASTGGGTSSNGLTATSRPAGTAAQAVGEDKTETVRLSFRKGGDKEAYRRLKNVLSDKAWERAASLTERGSRALADRTDSPRPVGGIDGIMQSMSLEAKNQDEHMKDAFKDLEVLMVRAGEMVKMAQALNAKLATSGTSSDEETTLIRSSLVQLGLPSPALTKDMEKDQEKYHEGLAKELGQLLTGHDDTKRGGLMVGAEGRGVIGLDEVWGLWMRARGVSLLPPSTLMAILPRLSAHTAPSISLLILPSSLNVLHTPSYAPPAVLSRLVSRLSPDERAISIQNDQGMTTEKSVSLLEIAGQENLPIGLTKELMESIEQINPPEGVREPIGLVRDDQAVGDGGVRWYRDIIFGWEL